jgi:hypothetical protein
MGRTRAYHAYRHLVVTGHITELVVAGRVVAACRAEGVELLRVLERELHPLAQAPASHHVSLRRLNEAVSRLLSPNWFGRYPVSAVDALTDGRWASRPEAFQILMALVEMRVVRVSDAIRPGGYQVMLTRLLSAQDARKVSV